MSFDDSILPVRTSSRLSWIVAMIAFVAGLAVMAAAIWFLRPQWRPYLTRGAGTDRRQPVSSGETVPTVQALRQTAALDLREQTLAKEIAVLESRLSNIDNDSRNASGFATRAEGMMVAFAARRALDRGLPLDYLENQLRERFGAVQPHAVATVIAAAQHPVTLEDLRLALDTIAPTLLHGGQNRGWWSNFRQELGDLIVLRQESAPSPRPSERLRRARRMLVAGQVEGALAEVARMPGADDAQSWIAAAKRYIAARGALDDIEATAIEGGALAPVPAATDQTTQAQPDSGAAPSNDAVAATANQQ